MAGCRGAGGAKLWYCQVARGRSKTTFANWKINANFLKFSALRAVVDHEILTLFDSYCDYGVQRRAG